MGCLPILCCKYLHGAPFAHECHHFRVLLQRAIAVTALQILTVFRANGSPHTQKALMTAAFKEMPHLLLFALAVSQIMVLTSSQLHKPSPTPNGTVREQNLHHSSMSAQLHAVLMMDSGELIKIPRTTTF